MRINKARVGYVMENNRWNQEDLAKRCGWDKAFLSRILNKDISDRTIKTVYTLAKGLGLKPSEIC